MNGTSFKAIEITDRNGATFDGSASLVWKAALHEAEPDVGELGGWEAFAGILDAYVGGHVYDRDELRTAFGRAEVNRLENYFENDALPEEITDHNTVYDDDGATFDAAAIRADEIHLIAAE